MLYFGGGEGEHIVLENDLGWVVSPSDYTSLNTKIATIIKASNFPVKETFLENTEQLFDAKKQFNALIEFLD